MDPNLIFASLSLIQTGIQYAMAREAGDPNAVMNAIQSGNILASLPGVDPDVSRVINAAASTMAFLEGLGMTRTRAAEIIMTAQNEGRDVTTEEVQAEVDATQGALDDLEAEIEAQGGTTEDSPEPVAAAPEQPAAAVADPAPTVDPNTPPENQ